MTEQHPESITEDDPRPATMLQPVTFGDSTEDELTAAAGGYWACIAAAEK